MADLGSKNIEDLAEDPKRAVVDGNSVEQHSLADLIAAAEFEAAKNAVAGKKRGFAIQKLKASGSQ